MFPTDDPQGLRPLSPWLGLCCLLTGCEHLTMQSVVSELAWGSHGLGALPLPASLYAGPHGAAFPDTLTSGLHRNEETMWDQDRKN